MPKSICGWLVVVTMVELAMVAVTAVVAETVVEVIMLVVIFKGPSGMTLTNLAVLSRVCLKLCY